MESPVGGDVRHVLLPGRAASWWKRAEKAGYAYVAVSSFATLVGLFLLSGQGDAARTAGVVVTVCWGVTGCVAWSLPEACFRRKRKAELRAGYTTLSGELINVDQVHPLTGDVIRRAGQAG